ncbi:MAG: NAD(P)-dependent oxidoreductase [Candidatus Polarisedimenticolaceae bacterium]|nr:NAD(P)-dependent oxidoreductase [Candidatus Polarisedimenticolaceae bacterium]
MASDWLFGPNRDMASQVVGILGATSLVGDCLLLPDLIDSIAPDIKILAFSRQAVDPDLVVAGRLNWHHLTEQSKYEFKESIDSWVSLAPIWVLPDYFPLLEKCGVRRVVALSSTSVFTKTNASDARDKDVADRLASGEKRLIEWAEGHGVDWVILRPTLIYGLGRDQNITSVAGFINRFGFFPLFGKARGLRQPIHAKDVAMVTLHAFMQTDIKNRAYNISGGEILGYKDMIDRVFMALRKKPRYLPVPSMLLHFGVMLLRLLPGFKGVSSGMAERMNQDLVFDHSAATRDFGFNPRPFQLAEDDLDHC